MMIEVTPEGTVICGWFFACDRPSAGYVELGPVPTCSRCAEKYALDLVECEVTFDQAAATTERATA